MSVFLFKQFVKAVALVSVFFILFLNKKIVFNTQIMFFFFLDPTVSH